MFALRSLINNSYDGKLITHNHLYLTRLLIKGRPDFIWFSGDITSRDCQSQISTTNMVYMLRLFFSQDKNLLDPAGFELRTFQSWVYDPAIWAIRLILKAWNLTFPIFLTGFCTLFFILQYWRNICHSKANLSKVQL